MKLTFHLQRVKRLSVATPPESEGLTPKGIGESIMGGARRERNPPRPANIYSEWIEGVVPKGGFMPGGKFLISFALIAFIVFFAAGDLFAGDYSHARIVRLSLAQGDVRVTRSVAGDALADQNAAWESAVVNLPLREGYVLATGNGRAEVEFENGAAAYLAEDTVLQFTELALADGARITRMRVSQGTATFYANPSHDDKFVVETAWLTASLDRKARFRVDAFQDGGSVNVLQGHVQVVTASGTNDLEKGQSLSYGAGASASVAMDRVPPEDDFDKWVAGREETVTTATNAALQYANSPYYTTGFADLSLYGTWVSYPGYGYCWQPFGAGFGWSPFLTGQWIYDPFFGWTWVSFEPWGWAPYHFGGWIYSPLYGWLWAPGGFGWGGWGFWRPATAVWVRAGGRIGIVPVHPLDVAGQRPVNAAQGIITPASQGGSSERLALRDNEKVRVLDRPPRGMVREELASAAVPVRVTRSIVAGGPGRIGGGTASGIVFDPRERKFINANTPAPSASSAATSTGTTSPARVTGDAPAVRSEDRSPGGRPGSSGATSNAPSRPAPASRAITPPPRTTTPPPARTSPPPAPRPAPRAESPRWESRPAPAPAPRPAPAPAPRPSGGRPH
jgi:hypothetical protein